MSVYYFLKNTKNGGAKNQKELWFLNKGNYPIK
jgi:hypothetical protein